jgi:hypothetical protein
MHQPIVAPRTRSRLALAALLALVPFGACRTIERGAAPVRADADRILRDIVYLADDRLEGRGTGTAGNDSAAAWLGRRHAELGLKALVNDTARVECRAAQPPAGCAGYLQRFVARGAELAHAGQTAGVSTQNVVAMVAGRDPVLAREYVVIGAHFDHLGRSPASALDPGAGAAIRNGADDNASGTAALLELARMFTAQPARRSIVFAHFSGEELGLLGSQHFVERAPVAVGDITAMVNFDMIGRLQNDRLIVYGVGTARELPALLDSANVEPKLRISEVQDGFGPSDHASFYAKGIPVLHFFTGTHEDYHRATDDADKINAVGEARIVALAERIVRSIADRPARLQVVRVAGPAVAPRREGSNVYLGTIPDMSGGDVPGLKLTGVRPGSPADKGGLAAGDVIVELGGKEVKDLYTYSDALYGHKPGEQVLIGYLRNGIRQVTTVTLGTRGQ